ncbi:MAG: DNA topoisomerase IV subunit B [bacterium]|nr:DNA topoisomerase IV subunit B [bacterium]
MAAKSDYKAKDIEVLEGLDPVRRRPGMYIGGTDNITGLHHLVHEILDNSIDEVMNGHADKIWVRLHKDGESVTVEDNGRGIPVDNHPKYKKSALEIILTVLHAGGKFSDNNYVSAGGLHGVGASVVNALSSKLEARVWRDGYEWSQSFSQGKPTSKLEKGKASKKHGTQIFFKPDPEIFSKIKFSRDLLEKTLEEKAFLNRGLEICFADEEKKDTKTFKFDEGITAYLKKLLENASSKDEGKPIGEELFFIEQEKGIKIQAAFAWTESTNSTIRSYVNGICTKDGGTHEDGFRSGLSKAIRNYISVHNLAKGIKLTGDDIREGLLAVLSINVPGSEMELQFQGQTKEKLNNPEIEVHVEAITKQFENTLNSKPKIAALLVERITLAAKARAASRAAAQGVSRKVGISHRLTLPGKLADCSSNRPDESEVFIVEGDSAGGSAKQARDRKTQAILPLRGKILNSIAAVGTKIPDNKELMDLVSAIGCGFGPTMNLAKLRYGKVIILTDADADGMHIASLLLAFFYSFMRPLVDGGHLYIGLCPLYRIKYGSGSREEDIWVYSDDEKEKALKANSKRAKPQITRFKGLGEMNPSTLWSTTMNPKSRTLLQIMADDVKSAEALFADLLGRDSSARYRLIQENAHRLQVDL